MPIILSLVKVDEWPPFGKHLLPHQFTICSLCDENVYPINDSKIYSVDFASDCASSWSLLTFYFYICGKSFVYLH